MGLTNTAHPTMTALQKSAGVVFADKAVTYVR